MLYAQRFRITNCTMNVEIYKKMKIILENFSTKCSEKKTEYGKVALRQLGVCCCVLDARKHFLL